MYNLEPPTCVCIDPRCCDQLQSNENALRDRELGEPSMHPITIFTRELGAVPAYSTSKYCQSKFESVHFFCYVLKSLIIECNTRYYPNYYVHSAATTRTYYMNPPTLIQSSQHFYMAADLCELFTTMMVTSW